MGRSWGVLSRLGGGFRRPRGILDASWVHLGSVRTRFEAIFGRSWRDLGGIWGTFWDVLRGLETSWGGLGGSWGALEEGLDVQGASWRRQTAF